MALATYSDLQASVASWMNRSDLSAVIPDFIAIAEARIAADVRLRQGLVSAAPSTVADNNAIVLPTDFLEFDSLYVNGKPLHYITRDRLREIEERSSGDADSYTLDGPNFLISPKPGTTLFNVNITYYAKLPALSVTPTNWLLTLYPNIYLYGALVSGYQFLLNDQRADYFGNLYAQAVSVAKASDVRASVGSGPLRIRTR